MSKLYRRVMACAALLIWLMAAGAGVHAHLGYGSTDGHAASSHHEGHGHHAAHVDDHAGHHDPVVSVHSVLDASHERQHAEGEQIDTGLEQLQSVLGKPGSKFDLLLPVVHSQLSALFVTVLTDFPAVSPPLKPPRQSSAAPPPLRAPPVIPA